ncbi:MAG: TetR/AcrR family transcriptional regulator [Melioribacter sp.]|uniref:TetR/AcrR family transcriptional regulator n=1 Tax=Melioribacter sp. TaxID=2052167 RepID=UPI003BCA6E3C
MDIKENIINSTIEVIEAEGMNKVTTRKIAAKAGVNVAAVNYYFGSQKKLIQLALDKTLDNAFKDPIEEFNAKSTLEEALTKILLEWFDGSLNYPNITKAHFFEPFVNNNYKSAAVKRLNLFFTKLHKLIIDNYPGIENKQLKLTLTQIFGALFNVILFPGLMKTYSGVDYYIEENRKEFVISLVSKFISKNRLK